MQIPVYVWAPEEEGQFQAGRCSRWWIHNSLAALEKDLQALGSRLIFLRASESTTALTRLLTESRAQVLLLLHGLQTDLALTYLVYCIHSMQLEADMQIEARQ